MQNFAVFQEGNDQPAVFVVRAAPAYRAKARELVVRVEAVGFNPADYRLKDGAVPTLKPHGVGSDLVGIVEQVGESVTEFNIGDRVSGYSPFHCSLFYGDPAAPGAPLFPDNILSQRQVTLSEGAIMNIPGGPFSPDSRYAAFQRQAVVFEDAIMKVPPSISVPEAATLGCAYMSAAQGIWGMLDYKRPSLELPFKQTEPCAGTLLVWGGSSSVGGYAIQFARLSGVRVVATASPCNFVFVKSLGAARVYDYNAPDVVERLRSEGITDIFDAIAEGDTPVKVRDVLRGRRGRVVSALPINIEVSTGIRHHTLWVPAIFTDQYKELAKWLYRDFSPIFIENGLIRPSNVYLVKGGLEKAKDMVYLQKQGKVRAKKPVLLLQS